MRPSMRRDEMASQIFGFSDESVGIRNRWRFMAGAAIWIVLSGMSMVFTIFTAINPAPRGDHHPELSKVWTITVGCLQPGKTKSRALSG
jgi:hypothetical protein